MGILVQDCQRCGANAITFDIRGDVPTNHVDGKMSFEVLLQCRGCRQCSLAKLKAATALTGILNAGTITDLPGNIDFLDFLGFVTLADNATFAAPDHLPPLIKNCFDEGARCFSIGAFNASAAMFRLTLDLASKAKLPDTPADTGGPNRDQRNRLHDRLEYLFANKIIFDELRELANCVREDGNDGAHDGNLTKEDTEDLIDFTEQFLLRAFTEPARLEIAKNRRTERRAR